VLTVGFLLVVVIYVQTAILFGVYTPELFPTEVRLRGNGICNTVGRGATIVSPFIVLSLFASYGVAGVLALMLGLVAISIAVVAAFGIEPARRPLEDLETAGAVADGKPAPVGG
jgi:putative MFS transporter